MEDPWPGSIPPPSPALVHDEPQPVEVFDAAGQPVRVSGRGVLSADPVRLVVASHAPATIVEWAGPWPCDERWWDPGHHRRRARMQVITSTDAAHLLVLETNRWSIEATYD